MPRNKIRDLSTEEFKLLVDSSKSYVQILRTLNLGVNGGNYITLKQRIKKENLDVSHFNASTYQMLLNRVPFKAKDLQDVMVENSTYHRGYLKRRLLKLGLLENKCQICKRDAIWEGKELVLILDHINGIPDDHRFENLRLICPNCNSQLDTFAGKNINRKKIHKCKNCDKPINKWKSYCNECIPTKDGIIRQCISCGTEVGKRSMYCKCCVKLHQPRKVNRPTKEELENLLKITPYTKIGKMFGVSDNAVKKWAKNYNILLENRLGYWSKVKHGKFSPSDGN